MNSMPFRQLKSFLKILIGVQYEKFFFLRPHLHQFIAECGNCHLFIHKFIISHSAVFGTFFCAVLPKYKINRRPSQVKKLSKSGQYAAKKAEHAKSSVRAKVEHVFGVVKKQLHFRKTRYRGLEKQRAKFNIMFALANLILADRPCLAA